VTVVDQLVAARVAQHVGVHREAEQLRAIAEALDHKVAVARAEHFAAEQVRALIQATPDKRLGDLLTAGFLTGARYGELIGCSVRDFDPVAKTLKIVDGKTGPRTVILQPEAVMFFARIRGNRALEEPLLCRNYRCLIFIFPLSAMAVASRGARQARARRAERTSFMHSSAQN
jgi:integrase